MADDSFSRSQRLRSFSACLTNQNLMSTLGNISLVPIGPAALGMAEYP